MTWGAFTLFPLELPALLAGLAALPGRQGALRALLVAVLLALAVQRAADAALFVAFNRGFNPVTDWNLVAAGWNLGVGTLGGPAAALAVPAAGLGVVGLATALWWATGVWAGPARGRTPRLGFGVRLEAAAMGCRGPAFNWITMPDQFTLAAFRALPPPDAMPDFGLVALISSRAPWVPVPGLPPWVRVGDGNAFARFTESAPTPREVWADEDRIRDQYRLAIDCSLRTVLDWAAREGLAKGAGAPLLIVLGDHPPVGFVSGGHSPDVPIHLIGPPAALAAFAGWGWTPGPVPAADLPAWPMEAFRDRFLSAVRRPLGAGRPSSCRWPCWRRSGTWPAGRRRWTGWRRPIRSGRGPACFCCTRRPCSARYCRGAAKDWSPAEPA